MANKNLSFFIRCHVQRSCLDLVVVLISLLVLQYACKASPCASALQPP